MENAFEFVNAWPVGHIALSCEASADDEVLRFGVSTICSLDVPASLIGLELSFGDNTLEGCIFLEVEDLVAGVEIVSQVVIVGIVVWPVVSENCQQSSHTRNPGTADALITSGMFNWYSGTSESTMAPATKC